MSNEKSVFQSIDETISLISNDWLKQLFDSQREVAKKAAQKLELSEAEKVAICITMGVPCNFTPTGPCNELVRVTTPIVSFARDDDKWHVYWKAEVPTEYINENILKRN